MNQGYLYETLLQASYKKGYANQEKEICILTLSAPGRTMFMDLEN